MAGVCVCRWKHSHVFERLILAFTITLKWLNHQSNFSKLGLNSVLDLKGPSRDSDQFSVKQTEQKPVSGRQEHAGGQLQPYKADLRPGVLDQSARTLFSLTAECRWSWVTSAGPGPRCRFLPLANAFHVCFDFFGIVDKLAQTAAMLAENKEPPEKSGICWLETERNKVTQLGKPQPRLNQTALTFEASRARTKLARVSYLESNKTPPELLLKRRKMNLPFCLSAWTRAGLRRPDSIFQRWDDGGGRGDAKLA